MALILLLSLLNFSSSICAQDQQCANNDIKVEVQPIRESVNKILFQNESFIFLNRSKAELSLTCSGHRPVHWEFKFDRGEGFNYWADGVGVDNSRTVESLEDFSSYNYTSKLTLVLRNTVKYYITKFATCYSDGCNSNDSRSINISSNLLKPYKNVDYDHEDENNLEQNYQVSYQVEKSLSKSPLVPQVSETGCDIVHWVKEISPTKLLWNCEKNKAYAALWFASTWTCKTIPRCTHYFYIARTKKSCVEFLKPNETCPGKCAVSTTLVPAVMHCDFDADQRMIPLVYSVKLHNGVPTRYYEWPWKSEDLKEMMHFSQLPSFVYLNETLRLKCAVSGISFAGGVQFGLIYDEDPKIVFVKNITSVLLEHVNQRVYTGDITGDSNLLNLTKIMCIAPVWNTSEWINSTQSIQYIHGSRSNKECGLEEETPKIVIVPQSPALFSTPDNLVFEGTTDIRLQLNCSHSSPVKWTFNFHQFEEIRNNNSFATKTFRIKKALKMYQSTLNFNYGRFEKEAFLTCESIENSCVFSKVRVHASPKADRTIANVVEFSGVEKKRRKSTRCRNILFIRRLSNTTFEWECRSTTDDADLATSELQCTDPLTCSNYFENAVNNERCTRYVPETYNCRNCRHYPPPPGKELLPRYLYCGMIYPWRTYQFVFYSLTTTDGVPNMYFRLSEADPEDMILMSEVPPTSFVGAQLEISCKISNFYFAEGSFLEVTTRGQNITADDSNAAVDNFTNSRVLKLKRSLSSNDIGILEIKCSNPHILTNNWTNITQKSSIMEPVDLHFLDLSNQTSIYLSKGESITLVCDASGLPKPKVVWKSLTEGLNLKSEINSEGFSVLHVDNFGITSTEGWYQCTATNSFGNVTKFFYLHQIEDNSTFWTIIIVGVVSAILVVIFFVFLVIFFRRWNKLREFVQNLTEEEVTAFLTGERADQLGLHESIIPVFRIPFNADLEIPRDKLIIDDSNFLGNGEFGFVFQGKVETKLVAVKTTKRNIDPIQFKAMLSEIKIMTYLGSHENIVSIVGACTNKIREGEVYIAIELCEKGSMRSFLVNNRENWNESNDPEKMNSDDYVEDKRKCKQESVRFTKLDLLRWSKQIAYGMQYLESKNIIHGDLASRNILLTGDLVAKISDFGLSRQLANYTSYIKTSQCALPWRWMSIEALQDMTFSVKSDIWAYGVTLWEMFSLGQIPYAGLSWNIGFIDDLANGCRLGQPVHADDEIFKVMAQCWDKDPPRRPSCVNLRRFFEDLYDAASNNDYANPFM